MPIQISGVHSLSFSPSSTTTDAMIRVLGEKSSLLRAAERDELHLQSGETKTAKNMREERKNQISTTEPDHSTKDDDKKGSDDGEEEEEGCPNIAELLPDYPHT